MSKSSFAGYFLKTRADRGFPARVVCQCKCIEHVHFPGSWSIPTTVACQRVYHLDPGSDGPLWDDPTRAK